MALLKMIFFLIATNAQFLKQPSAGSKFVPLSHQANLSCTVDEGYFVDWDVTFSDGVTLSASLGINAATFMQHGFFFTGVETSTSTLSFSILDDMGDQTNNATNVTCIAQQGVSVHLPGNETQVIFYGPPPPPTYLSVTEDELGSLNISWSLGFIEGVPVNYTLTVLNLNTTSAQPIIIAGLLDQHYVFETSRPCDVYSFTVTAVTAAGNSKPSQELTFSRNQDSGLCLRIPTMNATTSSGNTDIISSGEIAAIVLCCIILVVITIAVVVTICVCVNKSRSAHDICGDNHGSLQMPLKKFNCDRPIGLITLQNKVLVLERKGIAFFENFRRTNKFVRIKEGSLASITVHHSTGYIFVTTSTCRVLKLNSKGKLQHSVSLKNTNGSSEFLNGLCINDNKLYVCDTNAKKILILDLDLNYIRTITGNEENGKQFDKPRDVESDAQKNVYVAENSRIRVLSQDDTFVQMIGEGELKDTSGLRIVNDTIFVAHDSGVSLYSIISGARVHHYINKGVFSRPLGITVDNNGYLYVSTSVGQVVIFKGEITSSE